ncbi:hypothetical protein B0T26DRAFT_687056 [Lasiosphaeria miniovina]|uniref:Uncharacterized protein n=1 Tax=Lasiosphaeria miniovina TaxID=1954250 RepID=A0AA40BH16_9PEZI|nr:uncharacterized protein B0T26DRAFT_687056 [Lasiosphaeria miniovina]KAK0734097.1 hypothetical protein B0T26DRAFT_687056 [Lasiosphaeria miniovina]
MEDAFFGHNMQIKHTQAARASPYLPCLDFQQTWKAGRGSPKAQQYGKWLRLTIERTAPLRFSGTPGNIIVYMYMRLIGCLKKLPRYMVLLYPGHFLKDGVMVGDAQPRHRDSGQGKGHFCQLTGELWLPSPVSIRAVACVGPRKCLNGDNAGLDLPFEVCCPVHCRLTDLQNLEHPVQWPVKLQERAVTIKTRRGRIAAQETSHVRLSGCFQDIDTPEDENNIIILWQKSRFLWYLVQASREKPTALSLEYRNQPPPNPPYPSFLGAYVGGHGRKGYGSLSIFRNGQPRATLYLCK